MTPYQPVYYFRLEGDQVKTPGVDFGGVVRCLATVGRFQLWYCPSVLMWVGRSMPWQRAPSWLAIMQVHKTTAKRLKEVEPGRQWRQVRATLLQEMKELAAQDE